MAQESLKTIRNNGNKGEIKMIERINAPEFGAFFGKALILVAQCSAIGVSVAAPRLCSAICFC